ncbi:uncharacterized protein TC_0305-like isoform X2 [Liolophura sinensis]
MSGSDRSKTKVYVYSGLGCSDMSSSMLQAALDKHVDLNIHQVEPISGEKIINGTWRTDAALMIFGGGFDLGFIESLGKKGVQSVHDYVWADGGAYLGLCAGGYFACDSIAFDKAGPLEVCGERHLKFYPGQGIGPAYPGFEYKSNKGAVAASTDFSCHQPLGKLGTICLYTDGGGYFTGHSKNGDKKTASDGAEKWNEKPDSSEGVSNGIDVERVKVEVLAQFQDLPNSPAAIVKCHVGNRGGKAILSGVHFEYFPDKLVPGEKFLSPSVVSKLLACDEERQLLLVSLLSDLGLNIRKQ